MQKQADESTMENLRGHFQHLLQKDTAQSIDYIVSQLKNAGCQPFVSGNFCHAYHLDDGIELAPESYFIINGQQLQKFSDYFPFPFSANASINSSPVMALREKGVPWFMDVAEFTQKLKTEPSISLEELIAKEAALTAERGASALIIYNSTPLERMLSFNKKNIIKTVPIPVIYVYPEANKKFFSDQFEPLQIQLNIQLHRKIIKGNGIYGIINNNARETIIISSSFDENRAVSDNYLSHQRNALLLELVTRVHSDRQTNYMIAIFLGPRKVLPFLNEELGLLNKPFTYFLKDSISTSIHPLMNNLYSNWHSNFLSLDRKEMYPTDSLWGEHLIRLKRIETFVKKLQWPQHHSVDDKTFTTPVNSQDSANQGNINREKLKKPSSEHRNPSKHEENTLTAKVPTTRITDKSRITASGPSKAGWPNLKYSSVFFQYPIINAYNTLNHTILLPSPWTKNINTLI